MKYDKHINIYIFFSLIIYIITYFFQTYNILCSILQICSLLWGINIISLYIKTNKKFISCSIIISILFFIVFIIKGTLTMSWTFFLKIICIFIFLSLVDKKNTELYITSFSEIFLMFSIFLSIITFISMLFITDINDIPSIFNPISKKIYECSLSLDETSRYIGFFYNPNQSAMFSSIAIITSLYLIMTHNKYSLLAIISCIFNLSIILATQSRGSILTIAVFLICLPIIYLIFNFSNYSNKNKKLVILLSILFLIIFVILFFICIESNNIYISMSSIFRFSIPQELTIKNKLISIISSFTHGSGRDQLIKSSFDAFKHKPITGLSYQELKEASPYIVHNGFLFFLFLLGIPLFCFTIFLYIIISIIPIIKIFNKRHQFSKYDKFLISFMITTLICCYFYNCFEMLLSPTGNDGYIMLFLISTGILNNFSRQSRNNRVT